MAVAQAENKLEGQWLELFRAGDYGDKGSYDAAKLDEIVGNFDPAFHEPPVVIGHPATNAPAYGWIDGLKRVGDTVLGRLKQVDPAFASMVETGRFKKRSVALYGTAKGLMLRHVGFLGAQPPEIKGLADAKFNDGTNTVIEFEEDIVAEPNNDTLVQKIVDSIKGLFQQQQSQQGKTFSEAELKAAIETATKPLAEKLTTVETQFGEHKKANASAASTARVEAAIAKLKTNKHYINAFDKMGLPLLFAAVATLDTTIEFGEGDQKKKVSPLELMVEFFEKLPAVVPTGEIFSGAEGGTKKAPRGQQVNETASARLDQSSVEFSERVQKYADDKKISFEMAYRELLNRGEGPGSASAGAV